MSSDKHNGGCMCGAVRFIAHGAPKLVANCHCKDCRRASGAAFTTFVDFARDKVVFSQAPAAYQSSPGAERLYCKTCGSPIAYRGEGSPTEINMVLGAFDSPQQFTPTEDCHILSALWKTQQ